MDTNGQVSIQGKAFGDLGCKSKFDGTHQPCPHSGGTWRGHMIFKKSKKTLTVRTNKDLSKFGGPLHTPYTPTLHTCTHTTLNTHNTVRDICIYTNESLATIHPTPLCPIYVWRAGRITPANPLFQLYLFIYVSCIGYLFRYSLRPLPEQALSKIIATTMVSSLYCL